MSVLLGIDPGACTGWAYVSTDKGVLGCGILEVEPWSANVLDHPTFQPDRVMMEIPEVYEHTSKGNPNKTLVPLIIQVGRFWQYYTSTYRADCGVVRPKEWKGQLPKGVCHQRIWEKLSDAEQRIVSACGKGLPAGKLHNMLDALGIALFGVGRGLKF